MQIQQKITTFLWFAREAEEAVRFYTSVFPDSKVVSQSRWLEDGSLPKGSILTITFQLAGQEFIAMNGGPHEQFNDMVSLFVNCETQAEIDALWQKLTSGGGEEVQCGWLKDKYGLRWQIVPRALLRMIADPDAKRAKRAFDAMLTMKKLDLGRLQAAYDAR